MTELIMTDHTFSFEDVLHFLSQDPTIDLSAFGKPGKKTLEDLYEEHTEREVRLIFDPHLRRIVRYAFSTKTLLQTPKHEFVETMRLYRANSPYVKRQRWTVSETRKRTETPVESAQRGVREELGYEYPKEIFLPRGIGEDVEEHESKVYPGLVSRVAMSHFEVHLSEKIYPQGKIVEDHGVWIFLEWFERT
jgi:hypothetical protein